MRERRPNNARKREKSMWNNQEKLWLPCLLALQACGLNYADALWYVPSLHAPLYLFVFTLQNPFTIWRTDNVQINLQITLKKIPRNQIKQ